jgi:hypothetical protein
MSTSAGRLRVSLAVGDFDHVRDLVDGKGQATGLELIPLGPDLCLYGLEPKKRVPDTFMRYADAQGVVRRPLVLEGLFALEALSAHRR